MTTQRRFGQPGKQPVWTWDWPWRRFFRQLGGWQPPGGEGSSDILFTPQQQMMAKGIPPAFTPTETEPTKKPAIQGALEKEQADYLYRLGRYLNFLLYQGDITVPLVKQRLQYEEGLLREGKEISDMPYFVAVEAHDTYLESEYGRIAKENEKAAQESNLMQYWKAQGESQMADVSGNVMAERLRQQDQWRANQSLLLRDLPTGPEGEVARWFVGNMRDPWAALGNIGPEPTRELTPQGQEEARRGPPAPGWLPEYVPGTTAGEPVGTGTARIYGEQMVKGLSEMPFVPTPSGQQYTRMTPSQERYMVGLTNWFPGRSWEDIRNEMQGMQPITPAGAGQRRWRPSSQRIAI